MVLYSKSRWNSVNLIPASTLTLRSPITIISHVLLNERVKRNIETKFNIPTELNYLITSPLFWNGV